MRKDVITKNKVMIMNKKGIILHPATWIVTAFILGFVAAWLVARGIIPLAIAICP
jgi:hypothetical protein